MLLASQGGLTHPRSPQGCPNSAVKSHVLEQGACASRRRPTHVKTGPQDGAGGPQKLRVTLRQVDRRMDETTGNAGASQRGLSHPRNQQGCPVCAVKTQALKQGACFSRERPPLAKTRSQAVVVGRHGLKVTLM